MKAVKSETPQPLDKSSNGGTSITEIVSPSPSPSFSSSGLPMKKKMLTGVGSTSSPQMPAHSLSSEFSLGGDSDQLNIAKTAELTHQVNEYAKQIDHLKQEIARMHNEFQTLPEQKLSGIPWYMNLVAQRAAFAQQLQYEKQRSVNIENNLTNTQTQLGKEAQRNASLQATANEAEAKFNAATAKIMQLEKILAESNEKVQQSDAKMRHLKSLEEYQTLVNSQRKNLDIALEDSKQARKFAEEHRTQKEQREKEIIIEREKIHQKKVELEQIESRIKDKSQMEKELSELKSQTNHLKFLLSSFQSLSSESRSLAEIKQAELLAKSEETQLREQLAAMKEKENNMKQAIEKLQSQQQQQQQQQPQQQLRNSSSQIPFSPQQLPRQPSGSGSTQTPEKQKLPPPTALSLSSSSGSVQKLPPAPSTPMQSSHSSSLSSSSSSMPMQQPQQQLRNSSSQIPFSPQQLPRQPSGSGSTQTPEKQKLPPPTALSLSSSSGSVQKLPPAPSTSMQSSHSSSLSSSSSSMPMQQQSSQKQRDDQSTLAKLDFANKELKKQLESQRQQTNILESGMTSMEDAFSQLETQNIGLISKLREKEDEIVQIAKEKLNIEQLIQKAKIDLSDSERKLASSIELYNSIKSSFEAKEKALSLASQDNANFSIKLREFENEKEEITSKLRTAEQEKECQKKLAEDYLDKLSKLEVELNKTKDELKRALSECEKFRNKLENGSAESTEIQELKEEVKAYQLKVRCQCCNDREKDTVISRCWHVFCSECVKESLRLRTRKCPGCMKHFGESDVHRVYM
eukprot:TRINITY_DN2_c4_g1_i1.p1 TRINITY_DN2_c4_g1~~TRINITY_DN2_c4_g1_i1.p1  ORF type:complete len:799 (-),score=368.50 TRINITY_DN2_c4_g1_i1:155-2551(-)